MAGESSTLRRELEGFKLSTGKISERVKSVGDIWSDGSYASLKTQIEELAKKSRSVIENGNNVCISIDKFFSIAAEEV